MINYSTKQILKIPIGLFYNTIINVKDYKNFVPWCTDSWQDTARVTKVDLGDYNHLFNDDIKSFKGGIKVGFNVLDFSYTSHVYTNESNIVLSVVENSKIFERLESLWVIKENKDCTIQVDYSINFEFKNLIFSNATSLFLDFMGKNIVQAFIEKCEKEEKTFEGIKFDSEMEKLQILQLFENIKNELNKEDKTLIFQRLKSDKFLIKKVLFLSDLLINDNKKKIINELKSLT
jgi:ribosome-associated toxin RatA of RatAB toxin-antitoxin module